MVTISFNSIPKIVTSVFLLLATFSSIMASGKFSWPHYRGPNYDGISTEKNLKIKDLKKLWETNINTGFSSITVVNGLAYTMGNTGDADIVYCLDANSGKIQWKQSYPCGLNAKSYEGGPNSTPTLFDGKVYTLSQEGHLYCFNAISGKVLWSRHAQKELNVQAPSWGFSGSPTISNNKVYYNVGSIGLCLEPETGKTIWSSKGDLAGYSSPLPYQTKGKVRIALFNAKRLVAVDPEDGNVLWEYKWKTSYKVNAATPIVFKNYMFISSGYNEGCAMLDISEAKPQELWSNKLLRNQFNSSVWLNGHLYGIDGNAGRRNSLKCISSVTGELAWSEKNFGFGSLILADDKLIILKEEGELVIADARSDGYEILHSQKILRGKCWTVPTLCNGKLFARNAEGILVCLDMRGKK